MTTSRRDHYEVLQVHPSASQEVIQAAYRTLARLHHPDMDDSAEATKRMTDINLAYEVLKDPDRRASYDQTRRNWSPPGGNTANANAQGRTAGHSGQRGAGSGTGSTYQRGSATGSGGRTYERRGAYNPGPGQGQYRRAGEPPLRDWSTDIGRAFRELKARAKASYRTLKTMPYRLAVLRTEAVGKVRYWQRRAKNAKTRALVLFRAMKTLPRRSVVLVNRTVASVHDEWRSGGNFKRCLLMGLPTMMAFVFLSTVVAGQWLVLLWLLACLILPLPLTKASMLAYSSFRRKRWRAQAGNPG